MDKMNLPTKKAARSRKIPPKEVDQFEKRRQELIDGLLAASNPAGRRVIERGRKAGRELRRELEKESISRG